MSGTLFPTTQWLDDYRRALEASEALDDVAADWGVDFDGDVLLVIRDVPLETTTVGDLPPAVLEGVPEDVREQVADLTLAEAPAMLDGPVRAALPETARNLLDQLEGYVVDRTIYAYVALEAGGCPEVALLDGPEERSVGTTLTATCETWQQVVDGRPVTAAVLSGDLTVEGDAPPSVQYPTLLQLLGDVAADVETTHLFPAPEREGWGAVVDEAVRQPVALQQRAYRRVASTGRTLGLGPL